MLGTAIKTSVGEGEVKVTYGSTTVHLPFHHIPGALEKCFGVPILQMEKAPGSDGARL